MIEHETRRLIVAHATSTLDTVLDQVRAAGATPVVIVLDALATLFATPDHFRALGGVRSEQSGDLSFAVDDAHRTSLALAFGYPVQPLAAISSQSTPTRPVVTRIGSGTRLLTLPTPDDAGRSAPDALSAVTRVRLPPATRSRRRGGLLRVLTRLVAIGAALVILIAAGGAALVLQVHRATIDLYPAEEPFTRAVPFAVSVEATSDPNALQTRPFEMTVVREMDAPATGKKAIPDETATGPVTLRSRADSALTIRAGTILRAGTDVSYLLQADVTVPGLDFGRGQLGEATGRVRASIPGPGGNLPAGATAKFTENITYILGAVTGGTEKQVPIITEEDVARARTQLEKEVREGALADANKQIPPGMTPLNDFLKRDAPVMTATPSVGTQAESVRVRLAVPVRVPVYETGAFDTLVRTRLAGVVAEINRNGGAKAVVTGTVTSRPPTYLGVEGARVNYEAVISGTLRAVITPEDAARIGRTVAGKSAADAVRLLGNEPAVGRFGLTYGPPWLPALLRERLPRQPGNIAVRIVAPTP